MKRMTSSSQVLLAILLVLPFSVHGASLSVYLSAPGTESTFITPEQGASTADFNDLSPGVQQTTPYVSPIGTYGFSPSTPMQSLAADQYGGANNTVYISLGAQASSSAPVTITLTGPKNYFGFWFSAGDANNGISLYSGDVLLTRFSTATILTLLNNPSGQVTAINGSTYNSSLYFGNPTDGPNKGADSNEPFSYVNIIADGVTFDKIVLDNSDTTGTGFESDNHSVYAGDVDIPTSSVFVTEVPVPEPSAYMAIFLGFAGCLGLGRHILGRFRKSA